MNFSAGSIRAFFAAETAKKVNATNSATSPSTTDTLDNNKNTTNDINTDQPHQAHNSTTMEPITEDIIIPPILATTYKSKWNCTISPNQKDELPNIQSFLKGLIKALHYVHPPTWITPHPAALNQDAQITNEKDVPTTVTDIDLFAENPRYTSTGKLIMRLHFVTDKPMEEIIAVQMFKNWMRQQKLQMSISELSSPNPMFAGFFDDIIAETKRIPLLKAKIEQIYNPTDLFEYQIVIRTLYLKHLNTSAPFFVVLADFKDVQAIRKTFANSKQDIGTTFYHWKEYEGFAETKKASLIDEQAEIHRDYRCAILTGFSDANPTMHLPTENLPNAISNIDNNTTKIQTPDRSNNRFHLLESNDTSDDEELTTEEMMNKPSPKNITNDKTSNNKDNMTDTDMQCDQLPTKPIYETPNDIDMTKVTVTEFIFKVFKDSRNNPMFFEVRPPINGALQLFYCEHRKFEVEDLLPYLKIELARYMTTESIDFAFVDSEDIKKDLTSDKHWQPFELEKTIPEIDPKKINPYSKAYKQQNRKRIKYNAPRYLPPQNTLSTTEPSGNKAHYDNTTNLIPATIHAAPTTLRTPTNNNNRAQITQTQATNSNSTQQSNVTQGESSQKTSPTSHNKDIANLRAYCEEMVAATTNNLTTQLKAHKEETSKQLKDFEEKTTKEVRSTIEELKLDTRQQLTHHKTEIQQKLDEAIEDTQDIKASQKTIQLE